MADQLLLPVVTIYQQSELIKGGVAMRGVIRTVLVLAVLAVGLVVAAPPTHADTFNLTSCHVTGGCGTQTIFGTVELTQVGANVNFVVTLLGGNRFVETGSADNQLFKFNGAASAANIINEATSPNTPTDGVNGTSGAFNGDGTGSFNFGVACNTFADCNGGSAPVMTTLSFTVTSATIAQLTVPNADGNIFVADILIASNGFTGPVDVTGAVPEPSTLLLLGGGLVGLGFARRLMGRRR